MLRGYRTWFIILLVLALDVVTIMVPLFRPPWRWATVVVLTGIAVVFLGLRWLDWREQRQHRRDAYASLRRQRQEGVT